MSDDLRDELARTLALAGDEDGCFVRIDEWEAQEEWEREAHPDERPYTDYEDAEYWRRKADALMPIIERVKAEAKAEQREADAQIVESNLGRKWIVPETLHDLAAAIRAGQSRWRSADEFLVAIRAALHPVAATTESEKNDE